MKPLRLVGLFALAVLAHVESLSYWFVSTDTFALIRSSRIRSGGDLLATVTEPMMHGTGFTNIALFYRPLSSLSFAVDYWLWGLWPAGYHATNLVLHGFAVVLAAVVVAEVTDDGTTGLVAGGLFALHPLTAEVVPVVARRQDIVMLVFVLASLALFVRARRASSRRLYAAALVAYVLALAAKEPALLLPVLAAAWVATERGVSDPRAVLADGVRTLVPFAMVTGAYLLARVAVLGGLGGYLNRPSLTVGDLPALAAKYVLSMWYPANTVGAAPSAGGGWLVVPGVVAVLGGLVLGWALTATASDQRAPRGVALLGIVAGVGSVPVLLALDRNGLAPALAAIGYVGSSGELPFPYPYQGPAGPLIGLALVGAVVAGLCWSAMEEGTTVAAAWRVLPFFGVWLLLPLAVFYRSGDYAIRSGYPSLVPAMALLAVVLVAGLRHARTRSAPDPVPAAAVLLLVVPMVAATPLVHPYDGWAATGEVNRLTLTGLEDQLEGTPGDVAVQVDGIPTGIREQRRAFPRVASLGYLGPGSIEAWLALRDPGSERPVAVTGTTVLDRPPSGVTFHTERGSDGVTVRVRYETPGR